MYSGEIQNDVLEIGDTRKEKQNVILDFHKQGYPFRLSWSHYLVLMRIENPDERHFYEIESAENGWDLEIGSCQGQADARWCIIPVNKSIHWQ